MPTIIINNNGQSQGREFQGQLPKPKGLRPSTQSDQQYCFARAKPILGKFANFNELYLVNEFYLLRNELSVALENTFCYSSIVILISVTLVILL